MNQRWNAASFFVKQSRYQQVAAARAAGNIALADELADSPMLPPGTSFTSHANPTSCISRMTYQVGSYSHQ